MLAAELFEWAIDNRDPTRGNARIACRCIQLLVAERTRLTLITFLRY
jgi:hypothetical protein